MAKNEKDIQKLIRFVKACITEDDVVTAEFLKNEIQHDYLYMLERGKIGAFTSLELIDVCSRLVAFYDVEITEPIRLDIYPKER